MQSISWVVVLDPVNRRATELSFAQEQLRRTVGPQAAWLVGDAPARAALAAARPDPSALVLLIRHPWMVLEARCLGRLIQALEQGAAWAQACDSQNPGPMQPVNYATLRGMERFVDAHESVPQPAAVRPVEPGLVRLTTVAQYLDEAKVWEKAALTIVGAFAHDFSGYFHSSREEMAKYVPADAQRVLDVGGGEGNFLKHLKSIRPCTTHLVELDSGAASVAEGYVDQVWVGDLLEYQPSQPYDCVCFLDMLEHVVEPQAYLRWARRHLRPEGRVVASIPNVGHWSVVSDLLEGRWDYVPAGLHCITHLRFFTERTVRDLFKECGFIVEQLDPVQIRCPSEWVAHWSRIPNLDVQMGSLNTYAFHLSALTATEVDHA